MPLRVLLLLAIALTCAAAKEQERPKDVVEETPKVLEVNTEAAEIVGVLVYSDRAQVTRRLMFVGEAGRMYHVLLTGLTANVLRSSVRVQGSGPFTVEEVSTETVWPERKEEEEKARQLELKAKLSEVDRQISLAELHLKRVAASREIVQSYVATRLKVLELNDFEDLLKYSDDKNEKFDDTELAEADKLNELREQRESLIREGELARATAMSSRTAVRVQLAMEGGSEGILEVSYLVSGAKWTPRYELRVSPDERTLEVKYYGEIWQHTSEDWINAPLKLSTASPITTTSLPRLPRATVSLVSDRMAELEQEGQEDSMQEALHSEASGDMTEEDEESEDDAEGEESEDDAEEAVLAEAPQRTAEVSSRGQTGPAIFDILRRQTVLSCGDSVNSTAVIIHVANLPLHLTHYAVPAMDTAVFVEAASNNTTPYPLLPGVASVFVGNDFVTSVRMQEVFPGESFHTFVGPDPMVRMTVHALTKVHKDSPSVGLIWEGEHTERFSRAVDVRNTKSTKIHLRMIQQLPRPTNEQLIVRLETPEDIPKLNGTDAPGVVPGEEHTFQSLDTASVVWMRNIQPGKEIRIPFSFSVKSSPGNLFGYQDFIR